ncbi:PorV/PorQ family protein [candidate division KSB1 bacterium]|nr:PorV/PorQ family protein [candidate division KSB1 bacterium]
MKKYILLTFVISLPGILFAQAGSTGLALLKIGIGGQGAALGESVVAGNNGALSAYWNPAGLTQSNDEIVFGHSEWLQDISYEFIAMKFRGYGASWGLLLQVQNVDNIMHRTKATPAPLSTFSEHEVVSGVSYARAFSQYLSFGATAKFISERHFSYTSSGAAIDLGLNYQLNQIKGVQLGASLHNLGKLSELREEATKLPALLRVGVAYMPEMEIMQAKMRVLAAYTKIFNNEAYAGFGIEALAKEALALRIGYQAGREAQSISAGLGFILSRYRLDYAYVPFSYDLGDTHRLSFTFVL